MHGRGRDQPKGLEGGVKTGRGLGSSEKIQEEMGEVTPKTTRVVLEEMAGSPSSTTGGGSEPLAESEPAQDERLLSQMG